jgi:hypothetical protein
VSLRRSRVEKPCEEDPAKFIRATFKIDRRCRENTVQNRQSKPAVDTADRRTGFANQLARIPVWQRTQKGGIHRGGWKLGYAATSSDLFQARERDDKVVDLTASIGGVALQKLSMRGDEFVGSGGASAEAEEFLRTLGVSPDDVSVAIGFGLSTDTGSGVAVFVFRAEGADSDRLLQAFKDATDAERETPLEWESVNVGGKQVERATDPEQDNKVYLYVKDDLLAFVATTNEDDAAEVLGGMP